MLRSLMILCVFFVGAIALGEEASKAKVTTKVYFDVAIGGEKAKRIEIVDCGEIKEKPANIAPLPR